MPNPSGPYPGRQLFLGLTVGQKPCLAYLVTGRSPESRKRKALAVENGVRMGPIAADAAYDALKHYTALKYDNNAGIVVITNGIQTEAVFETYKLLYNVGTTATHDFMAKLMDGANAEPDTMHTPRIAGAIIINKGSPIFIVSIKTYNVPAAAYTVSPAAGKMTGISTYQGNLDNPEPTNPTARLNWVEFDGTTPQALAKQIFDMSEATYKGEDIRVCALGAIYSGTSWDVAILNTY